MDCIVLVSDGIESKKDNGSLRFQMQVSCSLPAPLLVSTSKHQKFSNTFHDLIELKDASAIQREVDASLNENWKLLGCCHVY